MHLPMIEGHVDVARPASGSNIGRVRQCNSKEPMIDRELPENDSQLTVIYNYSPYTVQNLVHTKPVNLLFCKWKKPHAVAYSNLFFQIALLFMVVEAKNEDFRTKTRVLKSLKVNCFQRAVSWHVGLGSGLFDIMYRILQEVLQPHFKFWIFVINREIGIIVQNSHML
jgi:hypothetical protein